MPVGTVRGSVVVESVLWQGVMLVKEGHDRVSEVSHILAHQEGQMTSFDLLVMNDVLFDLIASPACINKIGEDIISTREHSNGDVCFCGILDRNEISGPVLMFVEEADVIVSVLLEASFLQVLGVVLDGLQRRSVW